MKYTFIFIVSSLVCSSLAIGQQISNAYYWMSIGSLHGLYSNFGSEIEEGRTGINADQADGCRWPGIYRVTDMQAAKGLWIGAKNYTEIYNGAPKTWTAKVVHVGPRQSNGAIVGETYPVVFQISSKYNPYVTVDGTQTFSIKVDPDVLDPTQKFERVIDNVINTPIGLTMHRKIIGFGQQYHDNYIIYDYVFTNTGRIDANNTKKPAGSDSILTDVLIYFQNRYCGNKDAGGVNSHIMYGKNTVSDSRGERVNGVAINPGPATYFSTNTDNNDLRVSFAWGGYDKETTTLTDNLGMPMVSLHNADIPGDSVGRLCAYQFVGWATLHVDKSTHDTTDDVNQPSNTSIINSDLAPYNTGMDQYSDTRMQYEYTTIMSPQHMNPRHADLVGASGRGAAGGYGCDFPSSVTGGYSTAIGYGPFTIAPAESIHIVVAECAAGLTRDAALQIGKAWNRSGRNASTPLTYNGVTKTKNDWVLTGKDSLFQTVRRALTNYGQGYNLPQPPPPPITFSVNSGAGKVHMEWASPGDPKIAGWQIWRALGYYDSTYYKIWEGPASATSFDDVSANYDAAYYYYIVSVGYTSDNNGAALTPAGPLVSSRYYTQAYAPAYRRLAAPLTLDKSAVRIVPNPYNINTVAAALWSGQPEKVVFKNIPGICTIRIFTELGELINTINHTTGDGSADYFLTTSHGQKIVTGLYIAIIDNPAGDRGIYKFVVIR